MFRKQQGSRLTFAGFSREEWTAAMTGAMGERSARSYVSALFARLGKTPSNGFAFSVDTWARLALVSPACDERVRLAVREYPAEVRREVEERKAFLSQKVSG